MSQTRDNVYDQR